MNALTHAAADRLRAELSELDSTLIPEAYELILESRSAGDIGENPDYHIAEENHGRLVRRREEIERILSTAEIIGAVAGDKVEVGVRVTIDFGGGDTEEYLVGSIEERCDEVEVLTPESPLGAALLGHAAGDVVEYPTPTGSLKVTLTEIKV